MWRLDSVSVESSVPNNRSGLVPSTVLYSLSDTTRDATETVLEAGAFTAEDSATRNDSGPFGFIAGEGIITPFLSDPARIWSEMFGTAGACFNPAGPAPSSLRVE